MSRRFDRTTYAEARQAAQERALGIFAGCPVRGGGGLLEPNLEPSDARLEGFHVEAIPQLGRFVRRELTRDQLAANLRALARRHHVEPFVNWRDFPLD